MFDKKQVHDVLSNEPQSTGEILKKCGFCTGDVVKYAEAWYKMRDLLTEIGARNNVAGWFI